jgi:hypothetical protein
MLQNLDLLDYFLLAGSVIYFGCCYYGGFDMPIPHHDPLEFVAGDDWDIGAALLRPDGTAYDLTDASVIWMLRGPDGAPALQDSQYNPAGASWLLSAAPFFVVGL